MNFFRKINKQNDAHRIPGDAKSHTQSRCGGTVQNRFGDKKEQERCGVRHRFATHRERQDGVNKKAIKKADELGKAAEKRDVKKIGSRLEKMKRGPVADLWHIVEALWAGFKSPDIPTETKVMIIGALAYLVSPFDIVPDFLLPGGLLDDAAVIAFIYAQCKDIIRETIPKMSAQVKNGIRSVGDAASEQIGRITEDAVSASVGKQFQRYCTRTFFNSLVKLSLFTVSMLLLSVSNPSWAPGIIAASVLLIILGIWFMISVSLSCISCIKFFNNFFPVLKQIRTREAQNALANPRYKKLHVQDIIAEAAYTALAEDVYAESKHRKALYAFFFRTWNEGKLPSLIPRKRAMAEHLWNALKSRIVIFIGTISGYLIVYHVFVRNFLLPAVTDYTLPELLAYPFIYIRDFFR